MFAISGCADRERLTDAGGDETQSFTLGPTTTYAVSPGADVSVPDSITGGTFVLSPGGGELEVARILSGPLAPFPGDGFWVDYTGTGRVRLEFPDEPDSFEVLYAYGVDLGSISDTRGRVARWTCAPVSESLLVAPGELRIRYELILPFDWSPPARRGLGAGIPTAASGTAPVGAASVALTATRTGFQAYHLSHLSPQSTSVQRFEAAQRDAWRYLSTVIDTLPPALGGYVATQTSSGAAFEPTFYNSDDHKYKGFIYLTSLAPITYPMIFLGPSATEHSVAHETGHWVNHILAGSVRYLVLEAQAPQEHAIGETHGFRSNLIEDYAHFCDYFCTGLVLVETPEEPWQLFQAFPASSDLSPSAVDWPSLEGFGTVLLASLIRQSPTIRSSTGRAEEFPVIGASFRQVWPLVASGAPTITALRDSVEAFLARRGQRALLPVLAERIGWRYHAAGRLVDEAGQPIRSARVQAIYDDGARLWRTPGTVTTSSDGRFSLSRIFPGDGRLRVWQGNDSTDVAIPVGWSSPTNNERNLGDVMVGGAVLAQLQRTEFVDISFSGEMLMSNGFTQFGVFLTTVTAFDHGHRPAWDGTAFDLDFTMPTADGSYSVTVEGTVSAAGREILTLTGTETWITASQTTYREFQLTGIPIEEASIDDEELFFSLEGPQVESHLPVLINTTTSTGQPPVTISSIDWQSQDEVPEVVVRFSTARLPGRR